MIRMLYRASQAGVKIDLLVRGICCLRPGVPGVSDTIRVTSIVGRFLEHSRIFYFRNGGEEEIYLGSADLMPRNLNRRVEMLFPVEDAELMRRVRDEHPGRVSAGQREGAPHDARRQLQACRAHRRTGRPATARKAFLAWTHHELAKNPASPGSANRAYSAATAPSRSRLR